MAVSVAFCTLAIHAPYRRRAHQLCADLAPMPVVVATDSPVEFAEPHVTAILCEPSGPMAADYLASQVPTRGTHGAAAYHDKRFAIAAALREHDTAIFLDADFRARPFPPLPPFDGGISAVPAIQHSIRAHLSQWGAWRQPAFEALAAALGCDSSVLDTARWCSESLCAFTRDGREDRFFAAWGAAAAFMQGIGVHSGEGGVIGLAAAVAGWPVNYDALAPYERYFMHEGGGAKRS
jgi:hypothetical protein